MSRIIRLTALALVALCALGSAVMAQTSQTSQSAQTTQEQEKPRDQFQGKVNVNEVLLDVLVTDAKGNVIVGLDKNDFVVTENGKPVELTGVAFYSNRQLTQSSPTLAKQGVTTEQGTEDRYFIFLFDDQKDTALEAPELLSQQLDAGRRARDWVQTHLLPSDWVAVLSYDARLKVQQDFTRDRKALMAAISDAMKAKDRESNYPSRVDPNREVSLVAGLPMGTSALRDRTHTIYDALQVIADAAGRVKGRKNLLLFTYGLPGQPNTFGQFLPDSRYFDPTVRALNDANVATYTIDLTPAGTEHSLSNTMQKLADDTGGRYFYNITNFTTPLDQVSKENNGYYLLSYSSEKPADKAGFQEVQVKATNPEFRVKARRGYEYGK
jgi:VWFA-related protein